MADAFLKSVLSTFNLEQFHEQLLCGGYCCSKSSGGSTSETVTVSPKPGGNGPSPSSRPGRGNAASSPMGAVPVAASAAAPAAASGGRPGAPDKWQGRVPLELARSSENYHNEYTDLGTTDGSGNCQVLHQQTGETRVLKTRSIDSDADTVKQELELLRHPPHPNLLRLHDAFQDATTVYMICEKCDGPDLLTVFFEQADIFDEMKVKCIIYQLLQAVNHLHQQHISHRDIQPEVLLCADSQASRLKLSGLQMAYHFEKESEELPAMVKTDHQLLYASPQVHFKHYTAKCDIWSCGVIMFLLLCGYPPFHGNTNDETIEQVRLGILHFEQEDWQSTSEEGKELLRHLLEYREERRLSAAQALESQWFSDLGVENAAVPKANSKLVQNMQKFKVKCSTKAYVKLMAASLDEVEAERMRLDFQALDADSDGHLSRDEIMMYLERANSTSQRDTAAELIALLDQCNSGTLDFYDFLGAIMAEKDMLTEAACRVAFERLDKDKSGSLSPEELKMVLNSEEVHQLLNDEVLTQIIADLSTTQVGKKRSVGSLDETGKDFHITKEVTFQEFMDKLCGVRKSVRQSVRDR
eukprot:TRINITY_DN19066_c0_g1_i1.p1 TRINITY_DN19066_c0_g1~~TRINITY_DN19066_c0_g1_i1.p1  ORF type:complete len:583 (+),score=172.30 TRINITY_DN19066_c0_g1_i1:168-1916(+)